MFALSTGELRPQAQDNDTRTGSLGRRVWYATDIGAVLEDRKKMAHQFST